METAFKHFDVFKIMTAPANRTLSRYRSVTGRSVLSIALEYLVLRSIAFWDKYAEGFWSEKEFDPLSLNLIIYLETCAWLVNDKAHTVSKQPKSFFILNYDR